MPSPVPAASPALLHWAGQTDSGPRRENNEDAFGVFHVEAGQALNPQGGSLPAETQRGVLFVLSDGVGGHEAGEVASQITVQTMGEVLGRAARRGFSRRDEPRANLLRDAARQCNGAVRQATVEHPERQGMAATLSALWLLEDRYYIVQVGDSRVYRLRNGRLRQLTCDQSEIGRQVFEGKLSEDEARSMPGRNVIESAVGEPPERFSPEIEWGQVLPGDVFLLCSDGLSDAFTTRQLTELLAENVQPEQLPQTVDDLVKAAITAYGRDNITLFLVHCPTNAAAAEVVHPPVKKGLGWLTLLTVTMVTGVVLLALATWLVLLPALDQRDRARRLVEQLQKERTSLQENIGRLQSQLAEVQDRDRTESSLLLAKDALISALENEQARLNGELARLQERIKSLDTQMKEERLAAQARQQELSDALDEVSRSLVERSIEYDLLLQSQQEAALTVPLPRTPATARPRPRR
ncbi:MAG: protein phosphatase 2C domain-containing protein [Opitutales bacterium]